MTSSRDIEKEEQEKWFSCLTLNMDAINDVMATFHMTNFWNDPQPQYDICLTTLYSVGSFACLRVQQIRTH